MKTIEITSLQNELVKYCNKLQNPKFRKQEKMILVDGIQTIEGFISDKIVFEYIFLKKDNVYLDKIQANNVVFVTDEILKKISTTKSPTDIIGIIKEPEIDKNKFKNLSKIALIDGIKDAGNLGTIIRSAAAFSIDGIILYNDCVDLYNTKVIRSTAQNIFKLPIIKTNDKSFILELKKNHKLISTVVNSKKDMLDIDYNGNFIIAFGSEAFGISDEINQLSDEKITIAMDNDVESLNLAICASIAFAFIKHKNNFRK